MLCCSTDLGKEYARKLEQLRREEELIQEEELEAEALAEIETPAHKVPLSVALFRAPSATLRVSSSHHSGLPAGRKHGGAMYNPFG